MRGAAMSLTAAASGFVILLLTASGFTGGTEVNLQKRILGGKQCKPNERNYHVRLEFILPNGMAALCGGSLVSDQWVLTAAHCWEKGGIMYAVVGVNKGTTQTVQIQTEPIFYVNNKKQHDLMLVKLPYPTNIDPVSMCQPGPLQIGDTVQVAGNAATATDSNGQKIFGQIAELQCANMKVVDCSEKRNSLKSKDYDFYSIYAHQHWICAKSSDGTTDIVEGDSGGGLVKDKVLYGVTVFGDRRAFKNAAVFLDICNDEYKNWIKKNTKLQIPNRLTPDRLNLNIG